MSVTPSPTPEATVACATCGTRNRVPTSSSGHPVCASCKAPLPWSVDAVDATFRAAIDSKLPVLVDVWAPWCGPCRMVAPAVADTAARLAGRLKVVKLNADDAPATSGSLGVQGIPTLLVFHHGAEVARQVGALPAAALGEWVDGVLAELEPSR
jgi:thioredoxin 2